MNKKNIIIGGGVLMVIVAAYFLINSGFLFASHIPLTSYDIQKDYCGKAIDYHYCKCAFNGEFCDTIGLSKDQAHSVVSEGYEDWREDRQKEECAEKDGRWVGDGCRK